MGKVEGWDVLLVTSAVSQDRQTKAAVYNFVLSALVFAYCLASEPHPQGIAGSIVNSLYVDDWRINQSAGYGETLTAGYESGNDE